MAFHLRNLLPEDYVVGPNDVIIGRGRRCAQNPGNRRFRNIVQATLEAYSNAPTKVNKSEIIMQVLSEVRADNGIGFVKQVSSPAGRFIQVEEASCRIAIAQAFRDVLSDTYMSSKKHKQIRRRHRLQNDMANTVNSSSCESVSRSFFLAPTDSLCLSQQSAKLTAPDCSSFLTSLTMLQHAELFNDATMLPFQMDGDEQEDLSFCREAEELMASTPNPSDLFSMLYLAFGNPRATSDPFEPTPIAESNSELYYYNACTSKAA